MEQPQIQFELENFREGTDNQKAVGIYGSFNINVKVQGDLFLRLYDAKLRKRREGDEWYVESEFSTYKNTAGESKKRHSYKIWPEQKDWSKMDGLIYQAKALLNQTNQAPVQKAAAVSKDVDTW